ncbi:kinase-like domain-containing protein [Gigaspora rosea]|uniref:Kinase-like domain-containing protein n=1 Tax=Gigaspora rosea TaxID=44941 RepID=A0A397W496_9GLOM|nr:kinase-like domain-containing protein [Gigaspora rosea]
MENVHIVMNIPPGKHGAYHVTLTLQQDGQAFQLRTFVYEDAIEWIPFNRLSNIELIGKGGFGFVYSAIWLDGIRKIEEIKNIDYSDSDYDYGDSYENYKRSREINSIIALKTLSGYIHADFHSGNILLDEHTSSTLKSYIADLGMSKKINEHYSEYEIYGVMPYVAPEVLTGQKFTNAADIYGFGVIMSEMSTEQKPFDDYELDNKLAAFICKGLRPEIARGTPVCYIELANKCMDSDPQKRPTAYSISGRLQEWIKSMENSDDTNEIKKQFLDADKIVKTMPFNLPNHLDNIYTSKIIDTREILLAINASIPIDFVEIPDTKTINMKIAIQNFIIKNMNDNEDQNQLNESDYVEIIQKKLIKSYEPNSSA